MEKNILMVYPEVPATYWSFKHALKFTNAKAVMPPLGLLTVAAMLPDTYSVKLVDLNVEELFDEDIAAADLVMISAMIVQKESFDRIVLRCKALGKEVAAGGPYPTSSFEKINGVDYFILDEGELTFPEFLADYEAGNPRSLYRSSKKPDITTSPVPRFDLIDHKNYTSIAIQNSRGCPFNCEFCDIIEMFGRVPRYKSPKQVFTELEAVYATGFRESIFIVDDNFIGNKNKAKELLREIVLFQISHNYPFSFYTEASVDLAQDEELLDLMVDAGFDMVFVGIETPDSGILQQTNKTQNTRQDLFSSVDIIQRKGIQLLAGFILGFDNETPDIFDRQIEFIERASIPHAMIGLMMALPNTQLFRRLEREGRLLFDTKGNNTHEMEMNFVPTLPEDMLVEGYKRVLETVYSPKKYFGRSLRMIAKMPKPQRGPKKIQKEKLIIFAKSFLKQFFSGYTFAYLSYLLKGFVKYPSHGFYIVELAIKGHHFFTITEEILQVSICMDKIEQCVKKFEKTILSRPELKSQGKLYAYRKKVVKKLHGIVSAQQENIQKSLAHYIEKQQILVENIVRRKVESFR